MLYFSLFESLSLFFNANVDNPIIKSPTAIVNTSSNILLTIIAVAIVVIMAALTIYIFIKLPSMLIKTSKRAVNETAKNITPIILRIQHKKDTPKNHKKLSSRLVIVIKLILIIAPVIFSFTSQLLDKQIIDFYIAMYVILWLAGVSLTLFVFQYVIAKLLLIKRQDLW